MSQVWIHRGGGGGLCTPNWGPDPSWGGGGGGGNFTKMCKKRKIMFNNEGKIVIQEKSFACGEQLS